VDSDDGGSDNIVLHLVVKMKRSFANQVCGLGVYVVQVKLVRVAGKDGEQVYIQIGDDEMEMLTQQQAEQVSRQTF